MNEVKMPYFHKLKAELFLGLGFLFLRGDLALGGP
jgi:hypothetical protein